VEVGQQAYSSPQHNTLAAHWQASSTAHWLDQQDVSILAPSTITWLTGPSNGKQSTREGPTGPLLLQYNTLAAHRQASSTAHWLDQQDGTLAQNPTASIWQVAPRDGKQPFANSKHGPLAQHMKTDSQAKVQASSPLADKKHGPLAQNAKTWAKWLPESMQPTGPMQSMLQTWPTGPAMQVAACPKWPQQWKNSHVAVWQKLTEQ
jgi:hypothetical protein